MVLLVNVTSRPVAVPAVLEVRILFLYGLGPRRKRLPHRGRERYGKSGRKNRNFLEPESTRGSQMPRKAFYTKNCVKFSFNTPRVCTCVYSYKGLCNTVDEKHLITVKFRNLNIINIQDGYAVMINSFSKVLARNINYTLEVFLSFCRVARTNCRFKCSTVDFRSLEPTRTFHFRCVLRFSCYRLEWAKI